MNKQQPCFMRYTTPTERRIARALIMGAIRRGWTVSVYDGYDWTLKNATALTSVTNALATTDADLLHFTSAEQTGTGQIWLTWGNDEDLIHDHSDNAAMRSLVAEATA